jgi:hypothetical protein
MTLIVDAHALGITNNHIVPYGTKEIAALPNRQPLTANR